MKWPICLGLVVLLVCIFSIYLLPKLCTHVYIFSSNFDEVSYISVTKFFPVEKSKKLSTKSAEQIYMEIENIGSTGTTERVEHGHLSHDNRYAITIVYNDEKKDQLFFTENRKYLYRYVTADYQRATFLEDTDNRVLELIKSHLENDERLE